MIRRLRPILTSPEGSLARFLVGGVAWAVIIGLAALFGS